MNENEIKRSTQNVNFLLKDGYPVWENSDDDDKDKDYNPENDATPKKMRISFKETWRTPERQSIRSAFKKFIDSKVVPSIHKCQDISQKCGLLHIRTLPQIRSWIVAEISRNSKNGK